MGYREAERQCVSVRARRSTYVCVYVYLSLDYKHCYIGRLDDKHTGKYTDKCICSKTGKQAGWRGRSQSCRERQIRSYVGI